MKAAARPDRKWRGRLRANRPAQWLVLLLPATQTPRYEQGSGGRRPSRIGASESRRCSATVHPSAAACPSGAVERESVLSGRDHPEVAAPGLLQSTSKSHSREDGV